MTQEIWRSGSPAKLLRRVQADIRAGRLMQPSDAAAFDDAIEACLSRGRSLDDAIGLTLSVGGRRQKRDELVRVAAAMLPDGSPWQRARELRRRWHAYSTSPWVRHRDKDVCPEREGSLEGVMWEALKLIPRVLCVESIHLLIRPLEK